MNERIKEVWIKAAREDSDPDRWDTQEQFIERFAELIVRECIDNVAVWEKDSRNHISYMLKRHFGVEQ